MTNVHQYTADRPNGSWTLRDTPLRGRVSHCPFVTFGPDGGWLPWVKACRRSSLRNGTCAREGRCVAPVAVRALPRPTSNVTTGKQNLGPFSVAHADFPDDPWRKAVSSVISGRHEMWDAAA